MKNRILAALCFSFMFVLVSSAASDGSRVMQLMDFGWKFHLGDIGNAQSVSFDDGAWRSVDLPHDFQIEQPWAKDASPARAFKKMSVGWYRKSFRADRQWKGKRIFIDFEGIMLHGDAWLNGTKIGGTDYGYLGFESDVSRLLNYEGDNILAVRASTGHDGDSRWYTGGGLYRDVHLMVKDTISVARHGVFVSTPEVGQSSAKVSVNVEVEGIRGKSLPVVIDARIVQADGREVGHAQALVPVRSKKLMNEVQLPLIDVLNPQLWSCETPALYTAEVTLTLDGRVLDRISQPFGIRTLEFSPIFGFKLNGKKVLLKGIANHHDLGAVGTAAFETAIERQIKTLKAFGFNHIRTSHNPYSESFLRMADKYGILIVDELFDKWGTQYWAGRKPWNDVWPEAIPEWVKRDRNHPSVVFWSLGSELQTNENLSGYPTSDYGITSYRILDTMLKRYDSTRKSTVAMFPAHAHSLTKHDQDFKSVLDPPELSTVTEISSHNYRYPEFKRYREVCPNLILYQSEAATAEMGKAFYGMQRDSVVGLAYWGAIEYWGESNGWPWKGWHFSYFDHTLQPYPQAYFIKSIYSDEPVVHIGVIDNSNDGQEWNDVQVGKTPISENWNRREGEKYTIVTYTNADEVELLVNGKSIGVQHNNRADNASRNTIFWHNVPYTSGYVEAIARNSGREVARHRIETTGRAVAVRLELEGNPWHADGMSLQYVWAKAVDSKGRVVTTASGDVTFSVSGVAHIIAVDNGNHQSDELFAGNRRQLHNGKALCILRSTTMPGKVSVQASVDGLKKGSLTMKLAQ